MLPFAETVLAWRLARGLTQAALARAAGIPRPNLSAIERGNREVTLKTLRALAAALDVRPGVLADGCAPNNDAPPLTRASLERIAAATVTDGSRDRLSSPREAALARSLRAAMTSRLGPPKAGRAVRPHGGRAANRAYFFLRATESPETVASLIDRTTGHLVRR